MRTAELLLYRPLPSPLHAARAGVAAVWALALCAAAVLLYHPAALAALVLALLGAGWGAGVGRPLMRSLRAAAYMAVPIVAINVLVSREGLTVFARLGDLGPFGQGELTVEALVYGAVISLKLVLLTLVTGLASLAIDPDALLALARRRSFRTALTASLAVRMVPLLAADAGRMAEARRTRPDGGPRGPRERAALLGAVVAGSLDRAMDVAATLELRGFAAPVPRRARGVARGPRRAWSRHDLAFALSAAAVLALALAARLGGAAAFDAYPLVHAAFGPGLLALCAALPLAVLAPFADRRGIE